jgi:hypothetical protein
MVNQWPSVSLTGLEVHVSMISNKFSNLYRSPQLLAYTEITILIITKEGSDE